MAAVDGPRLLIYGDVLLLPCLMLLLMLLLLLLLFNHKKRYHRCPQRIALQSFNCLKPQDDLYMTKYEDKFLFFFFFWPLSSLKKR